jgi:hypothetical protein
MEGAKEYISFMKVSWFLIKQRRLSGGLYHRCDNQKEPLVIRRVAGKNKHGKFGDRISTA